MDPNKDQEIEARLSRIESTLVALQRSIDGLISERRGASSNAEQRQREFSPSSSARASARARATAGDDIGATISEWFSSRPPEWWLSRLGIGFVVIAILFLYSYAIEKGWITPPIRVLAGRMLRGGLLWWWAMTRETTENHAVRFGRRPGS